MSRVQEAFNDGEGIVLMTGVPGTGKTLLCHLLMERLDQGHEISFLTHTHMRDRTGLLQAVLHDLSLPYQGKAEQELRLTLIDHLLGRYREGKKPLLLIDEAHHLSADLLEELRLLGNLEGQGGKAVQILLVGQADLLHTLAHPGLMALRQRIQVRTQIDPLPLEEAADYLLSHLRRSGAKAEKIFGMETLEILGSHSGGIPRLMNQAAMQSLRLAWENKLGEVEVEIALEALNQMGLSGPTGLENSIAGEENVLHLDSEAHQMDPTYRLYMAPGRTA
ncbi:MAG: ExeA family protein [Gemmataceae bacterium]